MKLRILPLVIFVAFTLVVVKAFDLVVEKTGSSNNIPSTTQAIAEEKAPPAEGESPPAEDAHGGGEEKKDEVPTEGPDASPPVLSPNYSGGGPAELDVTNLSDMEKNLLENLAKRRTELEAWSASIAMKENVLNATEKKINLKMEELEKLKVEVTTLLTEYNEKEDKKVQRLVKIYESMKPLEAANIFGNMEESIALDVIGKMKEDAAAKVLAKMLPAKAQALTEKLALQRKLMMK